MLDSHFAETPTAIDLLESAEQILPDNPAEAVARARQAADRAITDNDRIALGRAHLVYGQGLRRLGDLVSAQSVLREAEATLQDAGEKFYLTRVWQAQAAIYNAAGKLDEAIERLAWALPLARHNGDVWTYQRVLTTWSVAAMRKGDYTTAIERLQEAQRSLELHPDAGLQTVVFNALGSIYQRTRNFETALQYFEQSLEISRKLRVDGKKESRNHAASLICISDTLITLGRTGESAPYLDEALEIAREHELLDVQASVLKAYGDRAMAEQLYEAAIRHYVEAHDLLEATGNGMIRITVLNQLGDAYLQSGDMEMAEKTLLEAVEFERTVASPEHEHSTHQLLATLYEKQNDFARATRHYKLALEHHHRLFSQQNQRALTT
jgi:tetratricopeptide (TPR) repeat protein